MLILLLLLTVANLGLSIYVVLHLRGARGTLTKREPAADGLSYTTQRLQLHTREGLLKHEVSFHGERPPLVYVYGGCQFRLRGTRGDVSEYIEVTRG